MQLPMRKGADRYFRGYKQLERSVALADGEKPSVLLYYAFDWRTRVGPFVGLDLPLANLGIRDVGGALYSAGFEKTRVVFGNWNPEFDFREARIDGRVPEVFGVGSMQINSADANKKIAQAVSLGEERPLIIGGGPHAIYQPWKFFAIGGYRNQGVDVAVKGEQNVVLGLMEVLLNYKARNGKMVDAFRNSRRDGALNQVPGLMYMAEDGSHLIDTGIPRVIEDYDELPPEIFGLSLLERKSRSRKGLNDKPVPLNKLKRDGIIISTLMSRGCNLRCSFCPIPAQQQYTLRAKSPEKVVSDLTTIVDRTGVSALFGTDDNAAFNRQNLENHYGAMARSGLGKRIFFATEATEGQIWAHRDLIPMLHDAGMKAIWFGIEDLTADLVKKGQSPDKTRDLFKILRENDIYPMPMMIHYDGQPLRGPKGKLVGLLDQVDFLRECGAVTVQVSYLMPITGSADEEPAYKSGQVFSRVGDLAIQDRHFDGNHVISTTDENPLERQNNITAAYEQFYNVPNFLKSLAGDIKNGSFFSEKYSPSKIYLAYIAARRISEKNLRQYKEALATGEFERASSSPKSAIPIVTVADLKAA